MEKMPFIQFLPDVFQDSVFTIDKLISKGAYSIQYRCCQKQEILYDVVAIAMKHSNLPRIFYIAEICYVISNKNLPTFYGIMRYFLHLNFQNFLLPHFLLFKLHKLFHS